MSEDTTTNGSSSSRFHSRSHSRSNEGGCLWPSLRILCLHDGLSNAGELSDHLEVLGERLYENHWIDLVYVNAPLLVKSSGPMSEKEEADAYDLSPINRNPQRVWWEEEEEEVHSQPGEDDKTPEKPGNIRRTYVGLDATLLLLRQVWNSMPFWGVIGVGKGAAAAAILALLPLESPPPHFMIFVRGETILEETELLVEDAFSSACLHLLGVSPSPSSERLLQQFGGRVVTGPERDFSNKAMNVMGKFIIEQKRSLATTNMGDGNILVLRNQLFLAEQEAANMVAQRIALDPPKALMAVISPQKVGGWNGGKRREPHEEGGGAPCPSDFLLRREKRTTDPNGPAREHPHQKLDSVNEHNDGQE